MSFDLLHTDDIRVEYCDGSRRGVQRALDACREERRPYLVITGSAQQSCCSEVQNSSTLSSILVPVTMLEEEVYKAEICTYLARKTGAHLILLRANDYGNKAIKNTQRIITHIQSISERTGEHISYEERVAKGDSFHIHRELHRYPITDNLYPDLILLTASREYGLDDWLFGPPEQYVIRHSQVPVMLVNPRADLFSLCD
jgi:nucleotide-binding universal stress UspA family protein